MNKQNFALGLALVAVVIAIGAYVSIGNLGSLGAISPNDLNATNYTELTASEGLAVGTSQQFQVSSTGVVTSGGMTIGSSGTALTRFNSGVCYYRPYAATIGASSTVKIDCQATKAWNVAGADGRSVSALSGITAGDYIVLSPATSTPGTTSNGLVVTGVAASTTAGFIEVYVSNLTGAAYTWPTTAGTASGTAYYMVAK
jgi:hypothetical protein